MQREVVLAMLCKEPTHGYEIHARLTRSLGSLAEAVSPAQIYVTLSRLEKAGLVTSAIADPTGAGDGRDRRTYDVTAEGRQQVATWLDDVAWPRPDLADFHLKLVAAATTRLADPIELVDRQRRELLRRLREVQRAAMSEPPGSDGALLLEGVVLRQQADLVWLEACESSWAARP